MIIIDHFLYQKDDDFELHLKREPNSCFINNYFNDGLQEWQENMDIQHVFNEDRAVTYYAQTFHKVRTIVYKPQRKQLRRLLRTICIILKQQNQSHKPF